MGKRTHFNTTIYTCDWTGLPVHPDKRYARPMWVQDKKGQQRIVRQGCYFAPECIIAHLHWLRDKGEITEAVVDKSQGEINKVACRVVQPAPPFLRLQHFGGDWTVQEYLQHLSRRENPVMVVSISETGEVYSNVCLPVDGSFKHACRQWPHTVQPTRKLRLTKGHRVVLHCNLDSDGNSLNETATALTKVNVYGDACLALHDEHDELLDYTLDNYKAHWTSAKRKAEAVKSAAAVPREQPKSAAEFQAEYAQLESALKKVEAKELGKLNCKATAQKGYKRSKLSQNSVTAAV